MKPRLGEILLTGCMNSAGATQTSQVLCHLLTLQREIARQEERGRGQKYFFLGNIMSQLTQLPCVAQHVW